MWRRRVLALGVGDRSRHLSACPWASSVDTQLLKSNKITKQDYCHKHFDKKEKGVLSEPSVKVAYSLKNACLHSFSSAATRLYLPQVVFVLNPLQLNKKCTT